MIPLMPLLHDITCLCVPKYIAEVDKIKSVKKFTLAYGSIQILS